MKPFANDLSFDGPPFRWNVGRRALLRAELDAYFASLYGLTRDELRYILDPQDMYGADFPSETFRVLKEREMRQYGEYRTRRLVLDAWDRLGLEPRNRDGRYAVESTAPPAVRASAPVTISALTGGASSHAVAIGALAVAPQQMVGAPAATRRALGRDDSGSAQPPLAGMEAAPRIAEIAPSAQSPTRREAEHLDAILAVLRRDGALSSSLLVQKLQVRGIALDEGRLNALLHLHGASKVERDPVTRRYRLKR